MINRLILVFTLLLGRIPLWVPFVALIFTTKLPFGAFLAFTVAIIAARYVLRAHPKSPILLRITSFFAWIYIVVAPDGVLPMIMTLIALYALELLAIERLAVSPHTEDSRTVAMQLR